MARVKRVCALSTCDYVQIRTSGLKALGRVLNFAVGSDVRGDARVRHAQERRSFSTARKTAFARCCRITAVGPR